MYAIVAGGGKVGASITRSLLTMGHEVTLIEQRRDRFEQLEAELGPVILAGDATEIHILERAGIARPPDIVLAVTGDDEDNIVIAQIAQDGYQVPKVIARVNDPRNQEHFDLLGVNRTLCATSGLLGLVEHEVPEHGLVKLLELRREGLEVVELQVSPEAPAAGKRVAGLSLPDDVRLVSITRNGVAEVAGLDTVIRPGDQVIAILKPGPRGPASQGARRLAACELSETALDAPVAARCEHQHRDHLEAAEPHEDRHRDGRDVAVGREAPGGAGDAEARADVPDHGRRRGDRVERVEVRPLVGGVDGDHAAPSTKMPT